MDVEYTGRQTSVTRRLKEMTEAGLERIIKIVGKSGNAHVILSSDKYRKHAEVTVQTRNQKLVAACESDNMVTALRDALAKIEQQAIRHKKRKMSIKRHGKAVAEAITPELELSVPPLKLTAKAPAKSSKGSKTVPMLVHSFPSHSPLAEPHLVRSADGVAVRPMSIEEAVKEAAFRDRDVFVFRDPGGQAMVLHRKRDGKMELIEVP